MHHIALMIPPRELRTLIELLINKPLLTRQDLSIRYRCTLRTIDNWHAKGILPAGVYLKGSVIPLWRPWEVEKNEHRKPELLYRRGEQPGVKTLLESSLAITRPVPRSRSV